jgi:hypothetical protein
VSNNYNKHVENSATNTSFKEKNLASIFIFKNYLSLVYRRESAAPAVRIEKIIFTVQNVVVTYLLMNPVMMKYMIIHFISHSERIKNPNDRELKAESKLDASKISIFSGSFIF